MSPRLLGGDGDGDHRGACVQYGETHAEPGMLVCLDCYLNDDECPRCTAGPRRSAAATAASARSLRCVTKERTTGTCCSAMWATTDFFRVVRIGSVCLARRLAGSIKKEREIKA